LIFDLGSNDYRAVTFARNLRRARKLSRGRLMIVFTMNKPRVRPFNRALRSFASVVNDVTVIDWHSVAREEKLLASDGVHAHARGYRRRARLIANKHGNRSVRRLRVAP